MRFNNVENSKFLEGLIVCTFFAFHNPADLNKGCHMQLQSGAL